MHERYDESVLLEYVEGEPDALVVDRVRGWARTDPRLRRLLARMIEDRDALRAMPDPPGSLVEDADARGTARRWVVYVAAGVAAVSVVTAVVLLAWVVVSGRDVEERDAAQSASLIPIGVPESPGAGVEQEAETPNPPEPPSVAGENPPKWEFKITDVVSAARALVDLAAAAMQTRLDEPAAEPPLPDEPLEGSVVVESDSEWAELVDALSARPSRARELRIEVVTRNLSSSRAALRRLSDRSRGGEDGTILRIAPSRLRAAVEALRVEPAHRRVRLYRDVPPLGGSGPDFESVLLRSLPIDPTSEVEKEVAIRVQFVGV